MCLQLGIDDPVAWMDAIPKRTWALWQAYWQVEPWGTDWERHADMMVMLDAIYAAAVNPYRKEGSEHKVREAAAFMPFDYDRGQQRKPAKPDITEQIDRFRGATSGHDNQ